MIPQTKKDAAQLNKNTLTKGPILLEMLIKFA
jgi:hypothetical protein